MTAPLAIVSMLSYHVGQLVVDTFIAARLRRHEADAGPADTAAV